MHQASERPFQFGVPAPIGGHAILHLTKPTRGSGFTLIELLVVISIIVLLLSLLAPSLDNAIAAAERAKCGANNKGIGLGMNQFLIENDRKYPLMPHWDSLVGKRGSRTDWTASHDRGINVKPLNPYVGISPVDDSQVTTEVDIANCPSDLGDPVAALYGYPPVNNCYDEYGGSYTSAYVDYFRVESVCGWSGNPTANPSKRQGAFKRTDNKIIVMEWNFFGDRYWEMDGTKWHNNGKIDERATMVLYADQHVEWLEIPVDEIDSRYGKWSQAPNYSFLYW